MKKFTTLALALAVSATAMAQTMHKFEPVKANDFSTVQIVEKSAQTTVEFNKMTLKGETLNTKAVPAGATVTPYCEYPYGTFFPYNTFALNGTDGYILPLALLPAYTDLDWYNCTYYVDPTEGPALAYQEYTWNWTYTDFNGGEASKTGADLRTNNQPYAMKSYPENPITMTSADGTLKYETNMPIFGGDGKLYPWFAEANGITNLQYNGSKPYNMYADDLYGLYSTGGSFGNGANTAGSGWEAYAEYFESQGASNFQVRAFAQVFDKPATPYALKKVSVMALVDAQAGAELTFSFFKMSNDGSMTNELVHQYTYTFTEAYNTNTTGKYFDIPVEFTTTDEFGFELDYKIIDCGMVMMVTGYENEKFNEFDLPVAFFLDEQPTFTVAGTRFYAYGSYDYNGNTYAQLLEFPYMFYTDNTRTQLMGATSMHMTVDVEYPYLMTYGNYTTGDAVEPAAEHKAWVKPGEAVEYGLLCYGNAEDILYTTVDGEDIPEWLEVEIADNEMAITGMTSTAEDILVKFAVAADADDTAKSCKVVLSYKGQTQTFDINQVTSGIEGIAADSNVAPKYYNLQGMEVANPENGLYIVKRGNNVVKEMIVK